MKAILNKLYGNNKRSTSVKAELREVKLNKVNELRDELDGYMQELSDHLRDSLQGVAQAKENAGTIQESIDNGAFISNEIDEIVNKLNDLGVPVPGEILDLQETETKLYNIGDVQMELETALENAEEIMSNVYQKFF